MPTKNYFPIFSRLKPGAYSYIWTEECENLLPKHYKARCLEYMMRDPTPVHWKPDPRRWKLDKHGTRIPVENHPIEVRYPTQCNKGLWGGEGIVEGLTKRRIQSIRVPRVWFPNIYERALYSEILDKWFTIPVTMRTLDLIDDAFGLDHYILGTHERDLNSKLGMDMKRTLLVALAKKSIYPDDPEKREDILTRYAKYIIPLEEAEWVGLSIEQALKKAKDIEAAKPVIPLKDIFTEELIKQLMEHKGEVEAAGKVAGLEKVKRFLSPFKQKSKSS